MGFFRELPNIEYLSVLSDRDSSLDYIKVKNLFRRVKVRDDLKKYFTVFDRITIKDGTGIAEVNGRYGNLILDSDRDNAVTVANPNPATPTPDPFRKDSVAN